jgi:hypothetical protein
MMATDRSIDPVVVRYYGTVDEVRTGVLEDLRSVQDRFGGSLNETRVMESLLYLLCELRQGILVTIRRGHPRLMAVVANAEYGDRIPVGPRGPLIFRVRGKDVSLSEYQKAKASLRPDIRPEIWVPSHQWWASQGILCQVNRPMGWGTGMLMDLLGDIRETCRTHRVPDCDFILNRRDVPVALKDGTHPYAFAGAVNRTAVPSLPIVGLYTGPLYLDQAWPMPWPQDGATVAWDERVPKALFRGSLTGHGGRGNPRTRWTWV